MKALIRRWRRGAAAASVAAAAAALTAGLLPIVTSQAAASTGPYLVGQPWSIVGMSSSEIFWHNSQTGETKKWYMQHNGVFQQQTVLDESGSPIPIGPPWSIAGVGEFGMSQDKDILWHNSQTSETQIWYLGSDGVTTHILPGGRRTVTDENGQPILVGLPWSIVATGDLNHDGTADIVWHNSQDNETQVWFMDPAHDGSQIKQRADVVDENGNPIFIGAPWSIAGSGDIDGDGHADIVWHNSQTNETQIWFMNGNQIARRATVVDESGQPIFVGAPWSIAGASDIDTDGHGDIVWHNSQTNETQIWFMNGNQIRERQDIVDAETPTTPPPTTLPPSPPTTLPPSPPTTLPPSPPTTLPPSPAAPSPAGVQIIYTNLDPVPPPTPWSPVTLIHRTVSCPAGLRVVGSGSGPLAGTTLPSDDLSSVIVDGVVVNGSFPALVSENVCAPASQLSGTTESIVTDHAVRPGSYYREVASCPAGSYAFGGGGSFGAAGSGSLETTDVQENSPTSDGSGWEFTAWAPDGAGYLTVLTHCAHKTGHDFMAHAVTDLGQANPLQTVTAYATCPAGYQVISGGYRLEYANGLTFPARGAQPAIVAWTIPVANSPAAGGSAWYANVSVPVDSRVIVSAQCVN
jgi:hypothetical protein